MSKDNIIKPLTFTKADSIENNDDFVEFIKKNATYKYIEDAKLLPDDGKDRTRYTKVLVVNRVEFDMGGLTVPLELSLPDSAFPNTTPEGINDTTSTTMVLFDHCRFVPPVAAPTIKLRFNFNVAFKTCRFPKGAEIQASSRIAFIHCRVNASRQLSVNGHNSYAIAKFSEMTASECGKLAVGFFYLTEFVNSEELPIVSLYNCRKVKMLNVTGYSFNGIHLHGLYDCRVVLENSHFSGEITFESSIFHMNIINSTVKGIRPDYCIVESMAVSNDSKVGWFNPRHSVLSTDLSYNQFTMAVFPMECIGNGANDQPGFMMYKKVNLWKGLAAIRPKLTDVLIDNLPFDFMSKLKPERIIALLQVSNGAKRYFCPNSHKIRVSEAKVIGFFAINKDPNAKEKLIPINIPKMATVRSIFNSSFKYKLDKVVRPKKPFSELNEACSSGIHGFLDLEDAISY